MDETGALSLDQFDAAQQLLADIDAPAAANLGLKLDNVEVAFAEVEAAVEQKGLDVGLYVGLCLRRARGEAASECGKVEGRHSTRSCPGLDQVRDQLGGFAASTPRCYTAAGMEGNEGDAADWATSFPSADGGRDRTGPKTETA